MGAVMDIDIQFQNADSNGNSYLTWRPQRAELRLRDVPANVVQDVQVELRSDADPDGGALVFSDAEFAMGQDTLDLVLPLDGSPVDVWIAGKFQSPSQSFGDVRIVAQERVNGQLAGLTLAEHPVMVRVRKNGESFTRAERDRFLSALATLNGQGIGRFTDLRDMHNRDAYSQIHSNVCFLPWHRSYLLDFERELQAIDPEVSLPYWRFDEAAPTLLQPSFMGRGRAGRPVDFSSTNPLRNWSADGRFAGVARGNAVGPNTVIGVRTEVQSLQISDGPNANFQEFSDWNYTALGPTGLEADPHNGAHGAHRTGWITDPTTSQLDPLFYLLHANVDRLWAKWQWLPNGTIGDRSDPDAAISYISGVALPDGHARDDTLWPWDGRTSVDAPTRPPNAPGGDMMDAPMAAGPGTPPLVKSMIDYMGANGGADLGFAYDDVPFDV